MRVVPVVVLMAFAVILLVQETFGTNERRRNTPGRGGSNANRGKQKGGGVHGQTSTSGQTNKFKPAGQKDDDTSSRFIPNEGPYKTHRIDAPHPGLRGSNSYKLQLYYGDSSGVVRASKAQVKAQQGHIKDNRAKLMERIQNAGDRPESNLAGPSKGDVRIDNQGKTSNERRNIQGQLNGPKPKGEKSSISNAIMSGNTMEKHADIVLDALDDSVKSGNKVHIISARNSEEHPAGR